MTLAAKPCGDAFYPTHADCFGIAGGSNRVSAVNDNGKAAYIERGCGHLEVEMVAGESAVTSVYASSPLKILVPRSRGQSVWAYMSSFGGGLVAGDEINLTIKLTANTNCFLSTQASTKIYRNPEGRPCGHQLRADIREGATLVLAPDPVQAFAGSSYRQKQEFHLESGAGLVLVDWVGSGRAACGERWAFERYQSRNDVFLNGKRIFVDSLLLDPGTMPLTDSHRMGRTNCLASVLIVGEPFHTAAKKILEEISARPVTRRTSIYCSASTVKHGVLLRLAGEQVEDVGREIHRELGFLAARLQDDPWVRKF